MNFELKNISNIPDIEEIVKKYAVEETGKVLTEPHGEELRKEIRGYAKEYLKKAEMSKNT